MTTADSIDALAQATRVLTIGLVVILAMRPLARHALGAHTCYALWWLVPALILAGLAPPWPDAIHASHVVAFDLTRAAPMASAAPSSHASALIFLAWLLGTATMAWLLWKRQLAYERSLGVLRRRGCTWISDCDGTTPSVLGALTPRMVLPSDFRTRFGRQERRLILAHERIHIQRGDLLANAAIAIVRCLFWFHPLVHHAAARMRLDQEVACDAIVVARHPDSRRTYGEAMLKTLSHAQPAPLGAHWGNPHPIKERIQMLTQHAPRRSSRILGAALLGAICSTTMLASWATAPSASSAENFTAHVVLDFANGAHKDLKLRQSFGKSFTIKSDEGGTPFALAGTVTKNAEGRYDLRAEIREGDTVAAAPHLVTARGKPARIRVGNINASGAFHGTTVAITFTAR
ncbi:hypothetical protein LYSHEL_21990 [Lysobacter helvus]|uniref:Peptidase M56 domain-containing protein n=2 Tax=Lysobacteraceae TaxID=32033 RepID=A0ABN6FTX5_9GAMM|nr:MULTISPECIES: M56 family metallopeptidase [Lysobacter]BCT93176.1 hypothetical protein LYSCAS_22000 [Lysobacter caseinilyticus]BCT96328.1 hypothetical protein LYSHEL_21990 [Lysobacter helvus]